MTNITYHKHTLNNKLFPGHNIYSDGFYEFYDEERHRTDGPEVIGLLGNELFLLDLVNGKTNSHEVKITSSGEVIVGNVGKNEQKEWSLLG